MAVQLSSPGVYVEEVPSGVRTIVGVSTSRTVFVGRAQWGRLDHPTFVNNFGDFERQFGGLWQKSTMSFAVRDYFMNGGSEALIIRVANGAARTLFNLGDMKLVAASEGAWGDTLEIEVDGEVSPDPAGQFNLVVSQTVVLPNGEKKTTVVETLRNLSIATTKALVKERSRYVEVDTPPTAQPAPGAKSTVSSNGSDGSDIGDAAILGTPGSKTGMYALEDVDVFNLLCVPPPVPDKAVTNATLQAAAKYCHDRRAMLIVDPASSAVDADTAKTHFDGLGLSTDQKRGAAYFFPRLKIPNPLNKGVVEEYVPCGAVAGVFARTDAQRGVWKAPAGIDAGISGVQGLAYTLSDGENGRLNQAGVNCLRTFPDFGSVIWGSRTCDGSDALASEWKYIPVRRMALYIEESLRRGLQWAVFEPNDEPLWAQIRLNVGVFMHDLFRKSAFQGLTPKDAYFVKCDGETTPQSDRNLGIVNVWVGFAPLKPAEFVIIRLQQMAGQLEV